LNLLIDTNILIDHLRDRLPATLFLASLTQKPCTSAISVAELFAGTKSSPQKDKVHRLLEGLQVIPFDAGIAEIAGEYLLKYTKSHSIGFADAAIGATANQQKLKLCTLNIKHFPMFPGLKKPY